MKSVLFGVVVLGVVACSGSTEHRSGRSSGAGGDEYSAGGDGAESGGSKAEAGKGGSGGAGSTGSAGDGMGGIDEPETGGTGVGGSDQGGTGQGGAGEGGTGMGGTGEGGTADGGVGGTGDGGTGDGGTADGGVGGEAGTAGTAGTGNGGEGGVGVIHVDPVCGENMIQVGAYSLWCGKVNMHQTEEGEWTHDADCSSGCNIQGVSYCQKYYPATTSVVAVDQTLSVVKDWKNAGCDDSYPDGKGISGEAACCAPYPVE